MIICYHYDNVLVRSVPFPRRKKSCRETVGHETSERQECGRSLRLKVPRLRNRQVDEVITFILVGSLGSIYRGKESDGLLPPNSYLIFLLKLYSSLRETDHIHFAFRPSSYCGRPVHYTYTQQLCVVSPQKEHILQGVAGPSTSRLGHWISGVFSNRSRTLTHWWLKII
jgi:hypothetical protein